MITTYEKTIKAHAAEKGLHPKVRAAQGSNHTGKSVEIMRRALDPDGLTEAPEWVTVGSPFAVLSVASSSSATAATFSGVKGYCSLRLAVPGSQLERRLLALGPYPPANAVMRLVRDSPPAEVAERVCFQLSRDRWHFWLPGGEEPSGALSFKVPAPEVRALVNGALGAFYHAGLATRHLGHAVLGNGESTVFGELFNVVLEAGRSTAAAVDEVAAIVDFVDPTPPPVRMSRDVACCHFSGTGGGGEADFSACTIGARLSVPGLCWEDIWRGAHIESPDLGYYPRATAVARAMRATAEQTGCGRQRLALFLVLTPSLIHVEPATGDTIAWNALASMLEACQHQLVGARGEEIFWAALEYARVATNVTAAGLERATRATPPPGVPSRPAPTQAALARRAAEDAARHAWDAALAAAREAHTRYSWPEGECYQALFDHRIDLGRYPTAAEIFGCSEARTAMIRESDRVVYVGDFNGVMHVSRTPMRGCGATTIGWVLSKISDDPGWTFGGLGWSGSAAASQKPLMRGECYRAMFDGPIFLGTCPLFSRVVDAAAGRAVAEIWYLSGVGKYLHVTREPREFARGVLWSDIVAVCAPLSEGGVQGATLWGHDREWWSDARIGIETGQPTRQAVATVALIASTITALALAPSTAWCVTTLIVAVVSARRHTPTAWAQPLVVALAQYVYGRGDYRGAQLACVALGWTGGWFPIALLSAIAPIAMGPGATTALAILVAGLWAMATHVCKLLPDDSVSVITYGSRGDSVPLQPYVGILRRMGYTVTVTHGIDPEEGAIMLGQLERGHLLGCAGALAGLAEAVKAAAGTIILAPLGALGLDETAVTFNLSPPPETIGKFRCYPEDDQWQWQWVVNWIAEVMTTVSAPDIRFGAFSGCAPRSANGRDFIETRPNTGERHTLLAFGSSSIHEPTTLDPLLTWSTRPGSEYRHEPDTDHNETFRRYRRVLCHGGAGTMQTAHACGAEAVSASMMIDREVVNWSGFQTTTNTHWFHVGMARALPLDRKMAYVVRLMAAGDAVGATMAVIFALLADGVAAVVRALALCFVLRDILMQVLGAPTVTMAFQAALLGPWVPEYVSVVLAAGLSVATRYVFHKSRVYMATGAALAATAEIWACTKRSMFWVLLPGVGPLLAAAGAKGLAIVAEAFARTTLPGTFRVLGILGEQAQEREDLLQLRLIRLHRFRWLGLPFCHWDLHNPRTGVSFGVHVDDSGTTRTYVEPRSEREVLAHWQTRISVDRTDDILRRLMAGDGRRYAPWRNCQTNLWFVQLPPLARVGAAAILVLCFFGMFALGALLGLAWLYSRVNHAVIEAVNEVYEAQGGIFDGSTIPRLSGHQTQAIEIPESTRVREAATQVQLTVNAAVKCAPVGSIVVISPDVASAGSDVERQLCAMARDWPYNARFLPHVFGTCDAPKHGGVVVHDGTADPAAVQAAIIACAAGHSFALSGGGRLIARRWGYTGDMPLRASPPARPVAILTRHAAELGKLLLGKASPIDYVVRQLQANTRGFAKRLVKARKALVPEGASEDVVRALLPTLDAIDKVLAQFAPLERKVKPVWAPMLEEARLRRAEELGVVMHENPTFVEAPYDDTLHHYVSALNENRGSLRVAPLAIGEFRRRVNRNPHIDLVLQKRYDEDPTVPRGVDGQIFACREVMVATLGRYTGSRAFDSLTDLRRDQVARAIVDRNPGLYKGARLADPRKLLNHWMKHPTYSAGLPFMGNTAAPLRTRADVRKAGWFTALQTLATMPLETGLWFPSMAHSFPKSQVVLLEKLRKNPAKLRSVTATSIIDNLQKGVLNFDINNRHDYASAMGKPGIPLTGRYLSDVFEGLDNYEYKFSADCTQMDANLPEVVFDIQARIRKIGYEDSPVAEVVGRHIDQMVRKTQKGFIVNLLTQPLEEARADLDEPFRRIWDSVPDSGWAAMWAEHAKAQAEPHATAPGGVVSKEHGGYTGDSDTTWTNTVGLQVMMIVVLAEMFDLPYDRLLDHIYLANVGDDNLLGLSFPDVDPDRVVQAFKDIFKIEMRFEASGGVLDQKFLGKVPREASDFAADFELIGIEPPRYAILHDSAMLKTRYYNFKGEAKRHFNKRRPTAAARYGVARCVGLIQLTAHQPHLYEELARDARVQMRKLGKQNKGLKIPSYETVLRNWYKEAKHPPGLTQLNIVTTPIRAAAVTLSKVMKSVERFGDSLNTHLVTVDQDEVLAMDLLRDSQYIFEEHAWHCLTEDNGQPPSAFDLDLVLRQSPYYLFTSARRFADEIVPTLPAEGPLFRQNAARARDRLVLYTALYMSTNKMIGLLVHVPGGNLVVQAFNLYVKTLPQLYAAANYVHFLAHARSSSTISAMMPKDAYYHHKAIALTVMRFVPRGLVRLPIDVRPVVTLAEKLLTGVSWLASLRFGSAETQKQTGAHAVPKPWVDAALLAADAVGKGLAPVIIAPTGTGKTRWFPRAALAAVPGVERIVICLPRKVLCEAMAAHGTPVKRKGTPWVEGIQCSTYGHVAMLYATQGPAALPADTLYILDECHEVSSEIAYLKALLVGKVPTVLMTATPEGEDPRLTVPIAVDVAPPHKISKWEAHGFNAAELFQAVVQPGDRILVIDPRKRQCQVIASTLEAAGHKIAVVHSSQRVIPEDLTCHIVATSIVDAGINIEGVTKVIDTGLMLVNDRGALVATNVTPTVATQRAGRTGRFCPGDYYRLAPQSRRTDVPVPSLDQVLGDSPIAAGLVKVELDPVPEQDPARVEGNIYARFLSMPKTRRDRSSLSLYHSLLVSSRTTGDANRLYQDACYGKQVDEAEFFMTRFGVLGSDLTPLPRLKELMQVHPVVYHHQGARLTGVPTITRGVVGFHGGNPPPDFRVVATYERDARAIVVG